MFMCMCPSRALKTARRRSPRVEGTYDTYDRRVYDFCKEGLAHFRFHPQGLPATPFSPSLSLHQAKNIFKTRSVVFP